MKKVKKTTNDKVDEVDEVDEPSEIKSPSLEFPMTLTSDELMSVIQILSFSKDIFEQMAVHSENDGNSELSVTNAARAKLSKLLYDKFLGVAQVGDKTRTLH